MVVSFIKQTTCFGPCTGPSSGLNFRVGEDYTVCVFLNGWFIRGSTRSRCFAELYPNHDTDGVERVSKRMTQFKIIISNNKNVLQLQNKLKTIK